MAKIAVRAVLNKGLKTYGQLTDRFFFGRDTANLDFSVLSLLDSKRDFKFYDRKVTTVAVRQQINALKLYQTGAPGAQAVSKVLIGKETFINDMYTPPLFYSSNLACFRHLIGTTSSALYPGYIGNFKGPGPVYVVDAQGSAGDFLPPGTKLVTSKTGLVHKYVDQQAFEPITYPANSVARDPIFGGINLGGMPMILGWSPASASMKYPYNEIFYPNAADMGSSTTGVPGNWGCTKFANFIHQDATYIVFFQISDIWANCSQYNGLNTGPPHKYELTAVRKSDGYQYNIVMVASNSPDTTIIPILKSVTTTEATPQKACIYIVTEGKSQDKYIRLHKIIGNVITSIGAAPYFINYFYGETITTQLMENKNASFNTHWKYYFPMGGYNSYSSNENSFTFQLIRFNKQLTTAPTITPCVLSGIPTEYCSANGDGTKLRCLNTTSTWTNGRFDLVGSAEIYDGADQYVAYWVGRTRPNMCIPDVDAWSFFEMGDTQYRWFLVFKVDSTDDAKLTYQSCVPEFKGAKPMYCYVASPDNKYMVMANADGLYCLAWSSAAKSFICTDIIALPGIISLGMDENQVATKCTVFVEVVTDVANPDDCNSNVYQVDFGNYEDVDLRYYNGTAYVNDFGYSALTLVKDGNGLYTQQTANFDVRVKNKVDGVETTYVTGKTVRLKISGVRETDGVAFVGCDSGIPLQKTITTNSNWLNVQFNYQYPIAGMKINAEIIA